MAEHKTFREMVDYIAEDLESKSFDNEDAYEKAYEYAESLLYDMGFDRYNTFCDEQYLEEYLYQCADEFFGEIPDHLERYIDKKQWVEDQKPDFSEYEINEEFWWILN